MSTDPGNVVASAAALAEHGAAGVWAQLARCGCHGASGSEEEGEGDVHGVVRRPGGLGISPGHAKAVPLPHTPSARGSLEEGRRALVARLSLRREAILLKEGKEDTTKRSKNAVPFKAPRGGYI